MGGKVAHTIHTHLSRCKNNKIKKLSKTSLDDFDINYKVKKNDKERTREHINNKTIYKI
jgi:hypothetical protein